MPSASDSAYPRLKPNPSATELGEIYTPNIFELVFAAESTRKPALQVGLLLLLKTFQRRGYFVRYAGIPTAIISHIARCADYPDVPTGLDTYDESAARARHMALVRNFVGVTAYGYSARKIVVDASLQAARTRDDLPDIINVALEELARQRYELPGFSTLLKIARAAKTLPRRASIRALAQHKTHRTLSLPTQRAMSEIRQAMNARHYLWVWQHDFTV